MNRPAIPRARSLRLCSLLPLLLLLAACAAGRTHRDGLAAIATGDPENGIRQLESASALDPGNARYRRDWLSKREQVMRQLVMSGHEARQSGRLDEAEKIYHQALRIEAGHERARDGLALVARDRRHAALAESRGQLADEARPGTALQAPRLSGRGGKPVSLQFRDAPVKLVFDALSRSTGINFILDKDIKADSRTTIFVQQIQVEDALDLILAQNQLARKVLGENSVLVYPNNAAKQKEYQDQIVKTFYLTNLDAKQAMNLLKTTLNAKVVFVDEKSNLLVMRDAPEAIRMAEKLIASVDMADPEVMMEVEVLEIKRSKLTEVGIQYPSQWSLNAAGAVAGKLTLDDLKNLDDTRLLSSPVGVTLNLLKDDSDTNILASPRIRARNREKAKIHIGDRVPVISSTVTPTTSGTSVVSSSVQYIDVGLKLEVEPAIHLDNDVAIKVQLEVSSILSQITTPNDTVAYQIGTRSASTLLRLRDGETQILAGLISDEERSSASKLPGLGDIPVLGRLFSSHKDDNQKTEIVLAITPRLVRNLRRPEVQQTEFWYGTETSLRESPINTGPASSVRTGTPHPPVAVTPLPAATTPTHPDVSSAVSELAWSGPRQARTGESFSLILQNKGPGLLTGFTAALEYDPAVLESVLVSEGDLILAADQSDGFVSAPGEGPGRLRLSFTARAGEPVRGQGSLFMLEFRARTAGSTRVTLGGVTLTGQNPQPIAVQIPEPLAIEIGSP